MHHNKKEEKTSKMIFSTETSRRKTTSTTFTQTSLKEKLRKTSKKREKSGAIRSLQLETISLAQKKQRRTPISKSSQSNSKIPRQKTKRKTPLVVKRLMVEMLVRVDSEPLTTTTSGAKTASLQRHLKILTGASTRNGCANRQTRPKIIRLTGAHSRSIGIARKPMPKDELNEKLSMGNTSQKMTLASMRPTELIRQHRRAVAGRPSSKAKKCLESTEKIMRRTSMGVIKI